MAVRHTPMYSRSLLMCYIFFLLLFSMQLKNSGSNPIEETDNENIKNKQVQPPTERQMDPLSNFNVPHFNSKSEWTSPTAFGPSLEHVVPPPQQVNYPTEKSLYPMSLPPPWQRFPSSSEFVSYPQPLERFPSYSNLNSKREAYFPNGVTSEVQEVPYQKNMHEFNTMDYSVPSTLRPEFQGQLNQGYDAREMLAYPNDGNVQLQPHEQEQWHAEDKSRKKGKKSTSSSSSSSSSSKKKKKRKNRSRDNPFVPNSVVNKVYRNCDAGAWSQQLHVIQTLYRTALTLFQGIPEEVFAKQSFHADVVANILSSLTLFKGVYHLRTGRDLLKEFQHFLQLYCPQVPKTNQNGMKYLKQWSEWMASLYSTWLQRESVKWVMDLLEARIQEYDMVFHVYLPELERLQLVYKDLPNFAEVIKEIENANNKYWYSYEHEWQAGLKKPGQLYAEYLGRTKCIESLVQRLLSRDDMRHYDSNQLFRELCNYFFKSVETIAAPHSGFQIDLATNKFVFVTGVFTKWKHTMISNAKIEC